MAVSVASTSRPDVDETDRARRFTSDEYLRIAETGILDEGGRTELIDGHILEMAPQNAPNRAAVGKTSKIFQNALANSNYWVQTQSTLPLDCRNVPEPDVAVLEGTPDDLLEGEPDEIPIIVEVADTSLEKDRTTKLRCYATNGIPEYWIINLQNETIEMYREPADGEYRRRETMTRGGSVTPLFDDSLSFGVDALLPQHPSDEDE
jgi:Uma2 family endonuclease